MTLSTTAPPLRPDLAAVIESTNRELGDLINALDVHGASYGREYAEHLMGGGPRPLKPAGLPPAIARTVREVVMDEVTAVRMYGPGPLPATAPRRLRRRRGANCLFDQPVA